MAENNGDRPLEGSHQCGDEEVGEIEMLLAAQASYIEDQMADEFPDFTYTAQVLLEREDLDQWVAVIRNNMRVVEREENLRRNAKRIAAKLTRDNPSLDRAG